MFSSPQFLYSELSSLLATHWHLLHLPLPLSRSNSSLLLVASRPTFFCLFWSWFLWHSFDRFFFFYWKRNREVDPYPSIAYLLWFCRPMLYPQSCSFLCTEESQLKFLLYGYLIWTYASVSIPVLSFSEPFPFYVVRSVMEGPKLLTVFKMFHSVTALSTSFCFFPNHP